MTQQLNDEQKKKMIDANVGRLTEVQSLAIVKTASAFRFGCNWGFLLKTEDRFADKVALLQEEKAYIRGFSASNGYILNINEDFLVNVIHTVVPNALDYKFVEEAQERRIRERNLLANYVKRAVTKGEGKQVKPDGKGAVYARIALYSLNDTNYITSRGEEYSAYKLNISEAVNIMIDTASKYGKKVYAKVSQEGYEPTFMDLRVVASQVGEAKLYRKLLQHGFILDSQTGVAIDFAFG